MLVSILNGFYFQVFPILPHRIVNIPRLRLHRDHVLIWKLLTDTHLVIAHIELTWMHSHLLNTR